MKKAYKNTIEEATECHFRLCDLSGVVKQQKWMGLIWVPFIFGTVYGLLSGSSSYTPTSRLIFAGATGIFVLVVHFLTYKKQIYENARKIIIKTQDTAEPIECEYELTDEHLIFRKQGQEIRFGWQMVKEVNVTPTSIEVIVHPMGIAIIPKRIFDPDEKDQWLKFIRERQGK